MILWENVAYLADEARRQLAFQTLQNQIGTQPEEILAAPIELLEAVTRHGILGKQFSAKLRKCAKLALEKFDGEMRPVLKLPVSKAKKALQAFPGIRLPGAEKILPFTKKCAADLNRIVRTAHWHGIAIFTSARTSRRPIRPAERES
jgi:hypothetical protein